MLPHFRKLRQTYEDCTKYVLAKFEAFSGAPSFLTDRRRLISVVPVNDDAYLRRCRNATWLV